MVNDWEQALAPLPDLFFHAFPFLSPCSMLGRRYFRVVHTVLLAFVSISGVFHVSSCLFKYYLAY